MDEKDRSRAVRMIKVLAVTVAVLQWTVLGVVAYVVYHYVRKFW